MPGDWDDYQAVHICSEIPARAVCFGDMKTVRDLCVGMTAEAQT